MGKHKKIKKLNKLKLGIVIFLVVFVISIAVFGRYIYNGIREAYFTAKEFYFTSNFLTANGAVYQFDNWGGTDPYMISFDLYSFNNSLAKMNSDLKYTLTCESLSPTKIDCGIGSVGGSKSTTGTIYVSQGHTSTVNIWVNKLDDATIGKGETVKLKVTARTEDPYIKEISCTYSLYIKLGQDCTYSIEDIANRDYAVLQLVNGKDVSTAVTLSFDPNLLRLDMNDEICQDMTILETTKISGKTYITKAEITLAEDSAKNIKFYKVDKTQDYTYPNAIGTSAITVNI